MFRMSPGFEYLNFRYEIEGKMRVGKPERSMVQSFWFPNTETLKRVSSCLERRKRQNINYEIRPGTSWTPLLLCN